ncbi:cofilin [Bulinus truncatus]|nr:cofilin [Bulinus truncatus]
MASGVKVDEDAVVAFKEMKLHKKLRFMILYIEPSDGLIKVEYKEERNSGMSQEEEFNKFLARLPTDIGRYCILDLTIPQKNGALKDLMFLITWCPSGAPTKSHILYTTSKKALTDKIREGLTDIQANDLSDLESTPIFIHISLFHQYLYFGYFAWDNITLLTTVILFSSFSYKNNKLFFI